LKGVEGAGRFRRMKKPHATQAQTKTLHFATRNIVLLVAGLAAITLGYTLLASGSTVAAPLLLVLGYVVLIPLGIIL